ncbi:MAG TPA: phospholipid carrier-dependent glycosyltransferase [Candidatus Caenarcaniphilales bacterium]
MTVSRSSKSSPSRAWFWLGLGGVWILAAVLRFWGLSRFNTLVFDEVYFAKFAHNYLRHTPFFDAHPPLGKYLIAVGIWLKGFNPIGYRWMNALTGSFLPLVVAGIAYQLSYRKSYALIAGLFTAVDGLLLVESRYALINVYLLLFGLLGQWFFLRALALRGRQRWLWLTLTGMSLGAAIAVKWNSLGFLLGIYLIWILAWGLRLMRRLHQSLYSQTSTATPLENLRQLNPLHLLYLSAIAAFIYRLAWIPHLQQNPSSGLWQLQKQMLAYHGRIGSGPQVHPYCSAWYTWPWMIRPVDYFYQAALSTQEAVPTIGPRLPQSAAKVIYDVHALGNPALWWLSSVAIILLVWVLAQRLWAGLVVRPTVAYLQQPCFSSAEFWVPLYLIVNYGTNFLPWAGVSRCTFLYHYMPAGVFSLLAIAWLVDRWLRSYQLWLRIVGLSAVFLILIAFVFWLPIYLGLPLSPQEFRLRMWFPSWI